jgi:hypothetical protein
MTLRCMIEKSELDRLLFIESKYKGLSTSAILKKGEGAQPSTCKDEEDCDEDPLAEDKSDYRCMIEKSELDRLLFIESKYKGLSTSAILKKGEGAQRL